MMRQNFENTNHLLDSHADATGKNVNFIINKLYNNKMLRYHIVTMLYILVFLGCIVMMVTKFIDSSAATQYFLFAFGFLGGMLLFLCWPSKEKRNITYLLKANATNILNDIFSGKVSPDPISKFVFADTFFFCRSTNLIVRYQDILWVYRKNEYTGSMMHITNLTMNNYTPKDIIIHLADGTQFTLHARLRSLANGLYFEKAFFTTILERNPAIMVGNTPENSEKYEAITDRAEKYNRVTEERMQIQQTDAARNYSNESQQLPTAIGKTEASVNDPDDIMREVLLRIRYNKRRKRKNMLIILIVLAILIFLSVVVPYVWPHLFIWTYQSMGNVRWEIYG